ncbi:ABC transporter ATP-binding protein [Aquamicrobium sp. LC103]|uniref:ABC transporter ATP-binding protein n=1 Tax=Aquamicrobium sp. LC103 TaxID=1120658 RepID=UPI00063E7FDC|nr:ABC transporter ATP-binding protein [Aquamicrobium sp. LC103]TKT78388.1 ABC transporter ATP-binding protein [Aquamicrobium sp. LC103]
MILDVQGIEMSYGALKVLHGIDLVVEKSETFAIIGPNGAGKTTLFKVLTGEAMPTAGTIRHNGQDITKLPAHQRARRGFGRTFQVARVFNELDLRTNVVISIESRLRYSGGNPGPWWRWKPSRDVQAEADEILDRFGFPRRRWNDEAGYLSHGDRKRLEFCVALATKPEVLMLDEPTAGMSPSDRKEMTHLLARLKAETGITILMTEHDMDIIFELADRLMVLNFGEVIAMGAPGAVRDNPTVRKVYLGQDHQHA